MFNARGKLNPNPKKQHPGSDTFPYPTRHSWSTGRVALMGEARDCTVCQLYSPHIGLHGMGLVEWLAILGAGFTKPWASQPYFTRRKGGFNACLGKEWGDHRISVDQCLRKVYIRLKWQLALSQNTNHQNIFNHIGDTGRGCFNQGSRVINRLWEHRKYWEVLVCHIK